MKTDLSSVSGFPLSFDPDSLRVESGGGMVFTTIPRKASELSDVLLDPGAVPDDTVVYSLVQLVRAPAPSMDQMERLGLAFSIVMIPPRRIGREYVKTRGHYHPLVPGTELAYPEVYTHYYGKLLLLLQRRSGDDPSVLDDCVLVELRPGVTLTIPPGYAHVLLNPTDAPAAMAGLYGAHFEQDAGPIRRLRGMAYYVVDRDGSPAVEANPRYPYAPQLRVVSTNLRTPFDPPHPDQPLWEGFQTHPDDYAFLTQPDALIRYYGGSGVGAASTHQAPRVGGR